MSAAALQDNSHDEDEELQAELQMLVEIITGNDKELIPPAIVILKHIMKTSSTIPMSVPKPLKYLAPYYDLLKKSHLEMEDELVKMCLADIISLLATSITDGKVADKKHDCLKYCLQGTLQIGEWGYDHVRHLNDEIIKEWNYASVEVKLELMPLLRRILNFSCNYYEEIQACDLLMEIDRLPLLKYDIAPYTFQKMCIYLMSCTKYVERLEKRKILDVVSNEFLKFGDYCRALIAAILLDDDIMVNTVIDQCQDKATLCQLAFIGAMDLYPFEIHPEKKQICDLNSILCNAYLSSYFHTFVKELDVLEPKTPVDIYKTTMYLLDQYLNIEAENLGSSFVNCFVNAGFGSDKLLTPKGEGIKWIYQLPPFHKISATAALGLLYLWDVDEGLANIDKYLYSTNDYIKSGALIAVGIVNCRVQNEFDPAMALLRDYVEASNSNFQICAIFGIGIAYAGSARSDVLDLLKPLLENRYYIWAPETIAITCLAVGLICLGRCSKDVSDCIFNKIILISKTNSMSCAYMRLAALGIALCYFGESNSIQMLWNALDTFKEPFKTIIQSLISMCSFAGSGDVLVIQQLLSVFGENVELPKEDKEDEAELTGHCGKWNYSLRQATTALAVASISTGEELGVKMVQRIFDHIGRYGDTTIRTAIPLAIALTSVSNPQLSVINILIKYSYDSDVSVRCNAIYGLGIIGAGTNNAYLAESLRYFAVIYAKNYSLLLMVRIAQGLVHLGKGTMTLNPWHTDRQLLDPVGMAGLLVPMVCLLEPHAIILNNAQFLLYTLVMSMRPSWLLTVNEDLEPISVTVKVGQAVDVVAKAGKPKTITHVQTFTTPILLSAGERAELENDEYEYSAPALDGICVLKKKM